MIARIWHGRTAEENYEKYTQFLTNTAIPDYEKTDGFQSLSFLRKIENDIGHFWLITYWDDFISIKKFAGEDYMKAKYYVEDTKYLLEFEEYVQHFEVFASRQKELQ